MPFHHHVIPDHRGAQNCCHRNVLHRIIDHGQQAEYGFHLRWWQNIRSLSGQLPVFLHSSEHLQRPQTSRSYSAAGSPYPYSRLFCKLCLILIPHIQTVFFICKAFDLFCDHFCFQFSGCIICCLFVQLFKSF